MKFIVNYILLLLVITLGNICNVHAAEIEFTSEEKAWIKAHPIIQFGYEPSWLPFEIYEHGEYKGIVGDYVKILERETGIDIEPIPDITWEETVKGLKSGKIDFTACAGITEERKKYLNFTKPYISSPMVIVAKKDAFFICGLSDLKGKTITLPTNYYTGEVISRDYPEINIDYKNSIEEAIRAVSLGKSDAFVGNLVVASYYIEHVGYSNLKIAAPTDYEKAHIGLAARKDWPEWISISQKVFDSISFRERNAILQKWMKVRYDYGANMKLIWKIIIYSLVVIILIIGGFLFWNETLRMEIRDRDVIEKELAETLNEISNQNDQHKNLLNEIHHRLKNNLHMISGMLKLQALEARNKAVEEQLDEAVERIRSIALIHEQIYKSGNSKNLNFEDFVKPLTTEIVSSFSSKNDVVMDLNCNYQLKNANPLPSLALILNELATNSLKYAFQQNKKKEKKIEIAINESGNDVFLTYKDNGTWIPKKGEHSLGSSLIDIFSEQLGGTYRLTTGKWTSYEFTFKNFYNSDN